MAEICGRPAKMIVLSGKSKAFLCNAHGDKKLLIQSGFKVKKARKDDTCGQSVRIEQALRTYGQTLVDTQDPDKAFDASKKEWMR